METLREYLLVEPWLHTAGQPDAAQLAELGGQGIRHVINLALPGSDNAVAEEAAIVAAQGINYFNLPIDFEAPRADQFDLFCSILDRVRGEPTLVHCAYNMRVSAFVYLYRVLRLGVDSSRAGQALHRLWEPYGVWKTFVDGQLARAGSTPG